MPYKRKRKCVTIPIDKNIPIPPQRHTNGAGRDTVYAIPLKFLQVGDSFLYPEHKGFAVSHFLGKAKEYGMEIVTRRLDEGLRVWRTK